MEKRIINIGPRLKQRRKEMHIKQIDMAKQLGVSQAFLSNVEAGKSIAVCLCLPIYVVF